MMVVNGASTMSAPAKSWRGANPVAAHKRQGKQVALPACLRRPMSGRLAVGVKVAGSTPVPPAVAYCAARVTAVMYTCRWPTWVSAVEEVTRRPG